MRSIKIFLAVATVCGFLAMSADDASAQDRRRTWSRPSPARPTVRSAPSRPATPNYSRPAAPRPTVSRPAPQRTFNRPTSRPSAPVRTAPVPRPVVTQPSRSYDRPAPRPTYDRPARTYDRPEIVTRPTRTYDRPEIVTRPTRTYDRPQTVTRPSWNDRTPEVVTRPERTNERPQTVTRPNWNDRTPQVVTSPQQPGRTQSRPTYNSDFVARPASGSRNTYWNQPPQNVRPYQPQTHVTTVTNNYYNGYQGTNCYTPYSSSYYNPNYYCAPRRLRVCRPVFLFTLGYFAARPWWDYYAYNAYTPYPYFSSSSDYYSRGGGGYYASDVPVQQVASARATPEPTGDAGDAQQERLLQVVSDYVASRSLDGKFRIVDPEQNGQIWSLELAQAPALFSMDATHYTVVAGFQGNLGGSTEQAGVDVQFFLSQPEVGAPWQVDEARIVSANGIVRPLKPAPAGYPEPPAQSSSHG